jgi:hypothetical protein
MASSWLYHFSITCNSKPLPGYYKPQTFLLNDMQARLLVLSLLSFSFLFRLQTTEMLDFCSEIRVKSFLSTKKTRDTFFEKRKLETRHDLPSERNPNKNSVCRHPNRLRSDSLEVAFNTGSQCVPILLSSQLRWFDRCKCAARPLRAKCVYCVWMCTFIYMNP